MNAITQHTQTPPATVSEQELIRVMQNSLYPGAQPESVQMALGYCRAAGLDPMQKPVHIVPMYDKATKGMRDVIMPGIALYRIQAARNGCCGISEPEFGPDVTRKLGSVEITFPAWCRVTVKRQLPSGEVADFTAREFWLENYATERRDSEAPNAMWKKRPYAQLAKCAQAQALRTGFPEIGGAPTADEMEGKELDAAPIQAAAAQREPLMKPRRKSEVVDVEATEAPKAAPLAEGAEPASPGEVAYIGRKLKERGMSLTEACAAAGIHLPQSLDDLTRAEFLTLRPVLK